MNKIEFENGRFPVLKGCFWINGLKFLIKERKKELDKKPPFYLWCLTSNRYISSLLPEKEEDNKKNYKFDFEGRLYSMKKNDDSVEIQVI